MNILLLHGSSDLYGASKIFFHTVDIYAKAGHRCISVLPGEGPLADLLCEHGYDVRIFNLGVLRKKYFSPWGIINRLQRFTRANKKIKSIIQHEKIDAVFTSTTAVLVGAYAAKRSDVPHVWHVLEIIEKPGFLKRFIGYILDRYSNKVICASEAVKQHWKQYVLEKKLEVIYNGIEAKSIVSERKVSHETLVIGTAGRIHYWKGQLYFLEIAKELLKKNPQLKFKIAGDPFPGYEYLLDEMHAFIASNQMQDQVEYMGLVKDMSSFYHQIDLFVLPSTQPDPFPTVILEAMDHGLPVVATTHGGALEMIEENKTGILIPWNDAKLAAEKIASLIDSPNWESMGEMGRERVHALFSRESFEKKLIHVIETL